MVVAIFQAHMLTPPNYCAKTVLEQTMCSNNLTPHGKQTPVKNGQLGFLRHADAIAKFAPPHFADVDIPLVRFSSRVPLACFEVQAGVGNVGTATFAAGIFRH